MPPFPVRLALLLLFFAAAGEGALSAGQALEGQQPGYHLSAGTRIVLTDVTVTDRNGQRVSDLQPRNFALTDNGNPQTLTSFVEHKPEATLASPEKPDSPGTFDNSAMVHPPPVVNVLLIRHRSPSLYSAARPVTSARNRP